MSDNWKSPEDCLDELREENAKLKEINAELLAACERYLKIHDEVFPPDTHPGRDNQYQTVRMFREAVAKAKA